MSSDQSMPAFLDDEGKRLWQAYTETGTRYRAAKREFGCTDPVQEGVRADRQT